MSWLFSQVLVEAYSAASCSDGEPCAQLNVMPTQAKFWRNDKTMEFSKLSQFGLTCAVLTASRGEELLTSYLAGFHASRTLHQETKKALKMKDGYGMKLKESLQSATLNMFFLKTYQASFLMGQHISLCKDFPKSGLVLHGKLYPLESLELNTKGSGYGYLPTPTAHNSKEGAYPAEYTRRTPSLATHAGGKINPEWTEWLMGWPIGWTDLKPLEMDKCHYAPLPHLNFLGLD